MGVWERDVSYNRGMRFIGVLATVVVLAGCGGGGGGNGGAAAGGGSGPSLVGPLIVRAAPGSHPMVSVGGNGTCNLYACSGAAFTSVITNLPHSLSNSIIEVSQYGQVWTSPFPPYGQQLNLTQLTNIAPFGGFGTPTSINALGRIAVGRLDAVANKNQIFVLNGDGSGFHQLSDGAHQDFEPGWTADNGSILFDRVDTVTSLHQIYRMSSSGTNVVSLDDNTADDTLPSQGSNGLISFTRIVGTQPQIWIMNADGSNKHAIVQDAAVQYLDAKISPDGTRVAAVSYDGATFRIVVFTIAGASLAPVTNPSTGDVDRLPCWSPDGMHILYEHSTASGPPTVIEITPDGQNPQTFYSGFGNGISWSSFLANKAFIAASGGIYGNRADAFVLSQVGSSISAFVIAVASSGGVLTASTDPNNAFAVRITAQGSATISTVLYGNSYFAGPITVPTTGAKQVIVSFDPATGKVTLVLPIASKAAAGKSGSD